MRKAPVRFAVVAVLAPLAWLSRMPGVDSRTADELARRFHFTKFTIPPPAGPPGGVVYSINPSAAHMLTYFHSIGASVVLGDVDGDGLPNDVCTVDIRTKGLAVEPVPGTGARYAPFEPNMGLSEKRAASWPAVCRLADFNEDGLTDVLVSSMERTPQLFLRKAGGAPGSPPNADAFERVELDPKGRIAYYPAVNLTDVDGDGHVDIVLGGYLPDGIRLYDADATERLVLWDGFSTARNGGEDRIFLWAGATSGEHPDVHYREVADPFPTNTAYGWTLAMASADIDADGLSDLFIANDFGPDTMLLNRSTPGHVRLIELKGTRGFSLPRSKVMGYDSYKSMGADVADINGDELPDFYVSNIGRNFGFHEGHQVWLSNANLAGLDSGIAPYTDVGEDMGVSHTAWSWDSRFDDFDNDGVMELVQATGFFKGTIDKWAEFGQAGGANPNLVSNPAIWPAVPPETDVDGSTPEPFWVRAPSGLYADLSTRLFPGYTPNSRAISTADVDGDGDLDLAFGNQWEDSNFFRNDAPAPGRSLGLHVLLQVSGAAPATTVSHPGHPRWREGTPAVGAEVKVHLSDGRTLVRQVDLSNGHTGARSPDLLFGLGSEPASEVKVEFAWRDHRGKTHAQTLNMAPGWQTVILGSEASS